jgi:hypothetical protein
MDKRPSGQLKSNTLGNLLCDVRVETKLAERDVLHSASLISQNSTLKANFRDSQLNSVGLKIFRKMKGRS